jgi:hypothetical protein
VSTAPSCGTQCRECPVCSPTSPGWERVTAPGQHAIEVVLKEPEWMKLKAPEPVTIEHEPKAPEEAKGKGA